MNILKRLIKVNEVETIDTSLTYSRVIPLQLTDDAQKIESIIKFELDPLSTSMSENSVSF